LASRPQCNQFATTFTKETAYGTAVANGSINKRYDPQEPIILGLVKTKVDDADKIKGHEFPSDPTNKDIVVARDITVPFSFDSSVELLGLLGAIFFGADSVTGSMPNFVHTYKAANLCTLDQFPSVSATLLRASATSKLFVRDNSKPRSFVFLDTIPEPALAVRKSACVPTRKSTGVSAVGKTYPDSVVSAPSAMREPLTVINP